MLSKNTYDALEREREKLIQLICKAIEQGIPITENEAILTQSRKVDALIVKTPIMKKKLHKDHPER